jgi:penicillin amidase
MNAIYRRPWFILCATVVLALSVLVAGMLYVRLRTAYSRPPERGVATDRLAGCPRPAEVIFDHRGIPHIRAEDDRALWFAQGYLHARERFYQMEMSRRQAAGRLAEVLGPSAVANDIKMRTWQVNTAARRQVVQLDNAESRALEAYAAGVNAALDRFGRWISPEIWLLGHTPEPWTVEDTLRIGSLMQVSMSWAMGEELERALVLGRLGRERATDLWGWSPAEARRWIPPGEKITAPPRAGEPIAPPLRIMGSNAWAVSATRAAGELPLLANDPHLGVQMPGIWTAVHLSGPGLQVAGLSLPGAPGVLVGHTDRVAWGMTTAMVDDQDLFVLTLDEGGTRELVDGNWQPLRTITEHIGVRWQPEPELLKVRVSEHGPVVREGRSVLALAWTGAHGRTSLGAVLAMNRARTVTDVADAWDGVIGPSVTVIAADTEGRIMSMMTGAFPNRERGAGRLPAPGADSRWSWRGFEQLGQGRRRLDPETGFVASANHDPFAEGDFRSSLAVPGEYDAPWRIRRIRGQLASRDDWDIGGFLELQADVVSGLATQFLRQLRPDLESHAGATAAELLEWDGRMEAGAAAPLHFTRLVLELGRDVGGDEALRDGLEKSPMGGTELLRLLAGGLDEGWWDDVRTSDTETRGDVISGVLDRLDAGRKNEVWGDVHRVHFAHPFIDVPLVGRLLGRSWSRGPFSVGGGSTTVNAHYWDLEAPFDTMAIPSARFVAAVGDWDATVLVLPTGQSGRPWSPHYADQVKDWLMVRNVTFPFSEEAVDASASARLILLPATSD